MRLIPAFLLATGLLPVPAHAVDCTHYAGPAQLCPALTRLAKGEEARSRFTRFELLHNQILLNGKIVRDTQEQFEDLWINDLPYQRLVAREGKPLEGQALAAEQARYDKAVADKKALDLGARAKQDGGHHFQTDVELDAIFSDAYRLRDTTHERCEETACSHLVFEPTGGPFRGKPVPARRIEFWITDTDPLVTSWRYELLKDEREQQKGSYGVLDYMVFDGVPVLKHSLFVAQRREGLFKRVEIHSDYTFDRYRRFATRVTIRSAEGENADSSSQPAPTQPKP